MGERASVLRVIHQKDLIHGAHIGKPVSDSACVALRYRDDSEDESVFSRRIFGTYYRSVNCVDDSGSPAYLFYTADMWACRDVAEV